MGQYYLIVNASRQKRMCVEPRPLAKMWEILVNVGGKPALALALLQPSKEGDPFGYWSGDRVFFLGDYAGDLPPPCREATAARCYDDVYNSFAVTSEFGSPEVMLQRMRAGGVSETDHHVAVNLDTKEYITRGAVVWSVLRDTECLFFCVCVVHQRPWRRRGRDPVVFGQSPSVLEWGRQADGAMRALCACLFWSTEGDRGVAVSLSRGRWAGSRIAIVRWDSLAKEADAWSEIGAQVAHRLASDLEA